MYHYIEAAREDDAYALPDVEVWSSEVWEVDCSCGLFDVDGDTIEANDHALAVSDGSDAGAYCPSCDGEASAMRTDRVEVFYRYGSPGYMPEGSPMGPFASVRAALAEARESAGYCAHGIGEGRVCEDCPAPTLWVLISVNRFGGKTVYGSYAAGAYAVTLQYSSAAAWNTESAAIAALPNFASLVASASPFCAQRLSDFEARRWGSVESVESVESVAPRWGS